MAFVKSKKNNGADVAPAEAAKPATTFIDQGCELSGQLRFKESVHIDGKVEGEIDCEKTVHVGEAAEIHADIRADSLVIAGSVDGDVTALRKITLHKSASVRGDMSTAGIVIEEGARFKGSIVIGGDEKPAVAEKPKASETAPTAAVPAAH